MKKQSLLYGGIGLLAGALITLAVATTAVNSNNTGLMSMMGMRPAATSTGTPKVEGGHEGSGSSHESMGMGDMASTLKDKTGDAFDQAFISEMITHHQSAIDMANLAKTNAKHAEIKNLANDIISAQSKEIEMMRTWQTQWGYKDTPTESMTGH